MAAMVLNKDRDGMTISTHSDSGSKFLAYSATAGIDTNISAPLRLNRKQRRVLASKKRRGK